MDSAAAQSAAGVVAEAWIVLVRPAILCGIVLPSVLLIGATAARWILKLPFSSWADSLMAISAFDATAILDADTFKSLFASPSLAIHTVRIHFLLLAVAMIGWGLVVWWAEAKLANAAPSDRRKGGSFFATGVGFSIAAALISIHVVTYAAR